MKRVAAALLAATVLVTACTGHPTNPGQPRPPGPAFIQPPTATTPGTYVPPRRLPQAAVSPEENAPSALRNPLAKGLPRPLVDPAQIIDAGPPPDGIPALADANFEPADTVDWLTPDEPVLSLTLNGESRACPVQLLSWHEIANDTVGGVPVAITYCPLCTSAIAFDRRVAGRVVTFGTSGKLFHSDLVMYDRQTRSLWPQLAAGFAVAGLLTGTRLIAYPVQTVSWRDWLATNRTSWVLSNQTGYDRSYGFNPYGGYDQPTTQPFDLPGPADPRLPPKTRIIALGGDRDPVAITLDSLTARRVLQLTLSGQDIVAWALPGLRSALDTNDLAAGRTIAATGAFTPPLARPAPALPTGRRLFRRHRNRLPLEHPRPSRHRTSRRCPAAARPTPGHLLVRLGRLPTEHPHPGLTGRDGWPPPETGGRKCSGPRRHSPVSHPSGGDR